MIDAKKGTDRLLESLADLVTKYNLEKRVIWGAGFNATTHE